MRYKRVSYKYVLHEDEAVETGIIGQAAAIPGFVYLDQGGVLTVKASYAWDGASGPTRDVLELKIPLLGKTAVCRKQSAVRASLFHDALYQLMRESKLSQTTRTMADDLLERLCIEDGFWAWRARLWRLGVERFAAYAAKPQPVEILTAP